MSKSAETRKVSIRDVAHAAGYSATVVSHALNGYARINAKTRERIGRIAERMGYRPNVFARSLATRRAGLIGMVVPGIITSFYPEILVSLKARLEAAGYGVLLMTSDDTAEGESKAIEFLCDRQVDGLVASPAEGIKDAARYEEIARSGTPVVMVNRWLPSTVCHSVATENVAGAEQATRHLLELGHRRIGLVKGPAACSSTRERIAGYKKALAAFGIAYDPELIQSPSYHVGHDQYVNGGKMLRSFLAMSRPPTALFALHDVLAVSLASAAIQFGCGVPDDLSIVGYDDLEVVKHLPVPLTTVAQNKSEMGRSAAAIVLECLEGSPGQKRDVRLAPELIVRRSTGEVHA